MWNVMFQTHAKNRKIYQNYFSYAFRAVNVNSDLKQLVQLLVHDNIVTCHSNLMGEKCHNNLM